MTKLIALIGLLALGGPAIANTISPVQTANTSPTEDELRLLMIVKGREELEAKRKGRRVSKPVSLPAFKEESTEI